MGNVLVYLLSLPMLNCYQIKRWYYRRVERHMTSTVLILTILILIVLKIDLHLYHKYQEKIKNLPPSNLLTLFTILPSSEAQRMKFIEATVPNWSKIGPTVYKGLFHPEDTPMTSEIERMAAKYGWESMSYSTDPAWSGLQNMRRMFSLQRNEKKTVFYGWSEWDIVFDTGLVETLNFLVGYLPQFSNMLLVGRTHNLSASKHGTSKNSTNNRVLFFITTGEFQWVYMHEPLTKSSWPPAWISSNWVFLDFPVVDITDTAHSFYQSDAHAQRMEDWTRLGVSRPREDEDPVHAGCISCATYRTIITSSGSLGLIRKAPES